MGRPKMEVRMSLKGRNGKTVRIGLVMGLDHRWHVYRNGKLSKKHPSASSTQIGQLISVWLRSQ